MKLCQELFISFLSFYIQPAVQRDLTPMTANKMEKDNHDHLCVDVLDIFKHTVADMIESGHTVDSRSGFFFHAALSSFLQTLLFSSCQFFLSVFFHICLSFHHVPNYLRTRYFPHIDRTCNENDKSFDEHTVSSVDRKEL